ncbi:tail protein [Burkholderia phage Bm1]
MARKILYPFARSGDQADVPDVALNGYVGYDVGYGFDYQRQLGVDPLFKVIDRKTFNRYMYDATGNIQWWQNYGHAPWFRTGQPLTLDGTWNLDGTWSLDGATEVLPGDNGYPKNAIVRYGSDLYLSLVDNNTTEPSTSGSQWEGQWFAQNVVGIVPMPYRGLASSTGDFRAGVYLTSGVWDFESDAKVASFVNAPAGAKSGVLEVRATPSYIIQVYRDGAGLVSVQSFTQGGGWAGWRTMVSQGQVIRTDSDNLVNMGDPGKDWNVYNVGGIYAVSDFRGANHPPVSTSPSDFGLLEVVANSSNNVLTQVVTKYLDGTNTEVFYRTFVNGTWSGWTEGDGRNKVNKSGDTMTGRLTLKGTDPNSPVTPEIYFQVYGKPNGMSIRGTTDNGKTGSIQIINSAYNKVLFEMFSEGQWVCSYARPSFNGAVPWDNGNFDPNSKIPVRPGYGSNGYVENLNSGNNQYFGWSGSNWYYQVDGAHKGIIWTSANFDPSTKAPANAQCNQQSDKSTEGPIGPAGWTLEISGDRFLTGVGAGGGASTANNIFINGRSMRNA